MLEEKMSIPFRLVCVTDDPRGIECETFPLWPSKAIAVPPKQTCLSLVSPTIPVVPNCFVRLRLFDPAVGRWFGSRLVSIDLDCVILQDLAPLLTSDTFKAARGYRSYICGSMWQLLVGSHADVWRDFDPVESPKWLATLEHPVPHRGKIRRLSGSDQAWMSVKLPDAPLWDESDGVYQYLEMPPTLRRKPPENARVVFFAGSSKPWSREVQMERSPLYDPIQ